MSDPPRVADQLQTIIDLLRQSTAETHNRLSQIESIVNNKPRKPYRYQSVIDYLKTQGRLEDEGSSTSSESVNIGNQCVSPAEAISILQELINEQSQRKCLTKEELISFFKQSAPPKRTTPLEPPFRK